MNPPSRALVLARFEDVSRAALSPDAAPETVLTALAFALVLVATGHEAEVGRDTRLALLRKGRRVLVATRACATGAEAAAEAAAPGAPEREESTVAEDGGSEDAEALAALRALAVRGLRALAGEPATGAWAEARADGSRASRGSRLAGPHDREAAAWHPPAAAVVAMARGDPDPVAAAEVAAHGLRCTSCSLAIAVLADREARAGAAAGRAAKGGDEAGGGHEAAGGVMLPRLRVAAADAKDAVRSPDEGVSVADRHAPDAEAVRFDEDDGSRHLAVYAAERVPVRLEGEGLVTLVMRPGYWYGRLAAETGEVSATLHVGEVAVPWRFDADAEEPTAR
jgi:hypothetical protein